jgi:hypothetical protein
VRACERKGASDLLRAREMCAAGARYGAARPDACGMRTTARPIRRGAAADACGMRTSGHTRQRVPRRAPTGSRGCPAERLSAAPRQRRYLPDLGGDTCLIWVAELPAAPRQHSGDSTVGRAPSGRAPATAPARSCDLCPQHTHVFRRALGEFGGSGRVPGRVPAPATPGDVSSYDMAVGRGHVITMQCFDAPATSSVYPSSVMRWGTAITGSAHGKSHGGVVVVR